MSSDYLDLRERIVGLYAEEVDAFEMLESSIGPATDGGIVTHTDMCLILLNLRRCTAITALCEYARTVASDTEIEELEKGMRQMRGDLETMLSTGLKIKTETGRIKTVVDTDGVKDKTKL